MWMLPTTITPHFLTMNVRKMAESATLDELQTEITIWCHPIICSRPSNPLTCIYLVFFVHAHNTIMSIHICVHVSYFRMGERLLRLINFGFLSITQPAQKMRVNFTQTKPTTDSRKRPLRYQNEVYWTLQTVCVRTIPQRCLRKRVNSLPRERWSKKGRGSGWLSPGTPSDTPASRITPPENVWRQWDEEIPAI